jgi:hypothetical protein
MFNDILATLFNIKQFAGKFDEYIIKKIKSAVSNLDCGGIYFIEGDSILEKEFYKIGMADKDLLERVKSYGTYYPFGIKIRGLSFSTKDYKLDRNSKIIEEIEETVKFMDDDSFGEYKKTEEALRKAGDNVDYYKYKGICDYYQARQKNNLFDIIHSIYIAKLEKILHSNIRKKYPTSKKFKSTITSRKNFGEFFKINKKELLGVFLETCSANHQITLYFPNNPLIIGEYLIGQHEPLDIEIYQGNKKIHELKWFY